MSNALAEPLSQAEARFALRVQRWADQAVVAIDAAEVAAGAARARPTARRPVGRWWPALQGWRAVVAIVVAILVLAAIGLGAASRLLEVIPAPAPTQSPQPPFEGIWPAFRLLSSEPSGVSIQVPAGWHRPVGAPQGFESILEAGTGNAGLEVMAPTSGGSDLESAVDAIQAAQWIGDWRPYVRSELLHGGHRAVRLESHTRADGGYVGGQILLVVERPEKRPLIVGLGWDSVPDLGNVEEQILRSLNVDGSGPAIVGD